MEVDLKRYMENGNRDNSPITLDVVKVSSIFVSLEVISLCITYYTCREAFDALITRLRRVDASSALLRLPRCFLPSKLICSLRATVISRRGVNNHISSWSEHWFGEMPGVPDDIPFAMR